MKISIDWLKDYVPVGISPENLAHKLTMAGLEVEAIERFGQDHVFEIEVTPNRSDCLSMIGVAREVSAILNKTKKLPKTKGLRYPKKNCAVSIKDPDGCALYTGVVIKGVKVKESPAWLKKRVQSLGLRPINNVVDITNFCLMEWGQPLHAFDYDKLDGGEIHVRRAGKGESLEALDGETYELDPSVLVIADKSRPVAVAGIMGGTSTEVTGKTKNILLESAYFDPILTRRASRRLGLSSDSSYRFERGVDPEAVETCSRRAVALILELAKGSVDQSKTAKGRKIAGEKKAIKVGMEKINGYLNTDYSSAAVTRILKKLDFNIKSSTKTSVTAVPPSFRSDITEDVDIIEEVARIVGYDNLPLTMPKIAVTKQSHNERKPQRDLIRTTLASLGFNETVSFSMINRDRLDETLQKDRKAIEIQNPLTQDHNLMRPTLLSSALSIVKTNVNRGESDLRLFELGKTYHSSGEREAISVVVTGSRREDWRDKRKKPVDFYDVKGPVEKVLEALGVDAEFKKDDIGFLEKGERAAIVKKGKRIGVAGRVKPEAVSGAGIKDCDAFFAELDLEDVLSRPPKEKAFDTISEFPSVVRDVSLAVKEDLSYETVVRLVHELGGDICASVKFNEEYMGEKISSGFRGLVFSVIYQSNERTLREEEVTRVHTRILDSLVKDLGAVIR